MKKSIYKNRIWIGVLLFLLACVCLFTACDKNLRVELKTPTDIKIEDETLTWKAVKNADGYLIDIDGTEYRTKTNSLDVFKIINRPKVFTIKVMAMGDWEKTMDSNWSDVFEYELQQTDVQVLLKDEGYVITDIRVNDPSGKAVIPASIRGVDVVSVAANAFENKTELTGILLPDSVESIRSEAFLNCTNLKRVYTNATTIARGAFRNCSALQAIQLSSNLTELQASTFYGCSSLTEIEIPKSVNKIGAYVFSKCDNLTSITVSPENATFESDGNSIVRKADNALIAAYKGHIPACVESIQKYAFSEDATLTQVTVPGHVKEIAGSAFFQCENLREVSFAEGVQRIESCFTECKNLIKIELPKSVREMAPLATSCDNLTTLTMKEGNPIYKSENNCIIDKQTNTLIYGCKASVIPEGVERIGERAFFCGGIENIVIPCSVKEIGRNAFGDCYQLKEVTFSEGLETIGNSAFCLSTPTNCSTMRFVFPKTLKTIGSSAFYGRTHMDFILRSSVESVSRAFKWVTIYSSAPYDEVPENWSFSAITRVYNCTLREDEDDVYVHSFVYVSSKEVREEDEWGVTVHYVLGSVTSPDTNIMIPSRKGYRFKGWSLEEDGEIVIGIRPMYAEDGSDAAYLTLQRLDLDNIPDNTVLYAVWEKNA